jgi:hypothetical protein
MAAPPVTTAGNWAGERRLYGPAVGFARQAAGDLSPTHGAIRCPQSSRDWPCVPPIRTRMGRQTSGASSEPEPSFVRSCAASHHTLMSKTCARRRPTIASGRSDHVKDPPRRQLGRPDCAQRRSHGRHHRRVRLDRAHRGLSSRAVHGISSRCSPPPPSAARSSSAR